jgi:hypothetical protein
MLTGGYLSTNLNAYELQYDLQYDLNDRATIAAVRSYLANFVELLDTNSIGSSRDRSKPSFLLDSSMQFPCRG